MTLKKTNAPAGTEALKNSAHQTTRISVPAATASTPYYVQWVQPCTGVLPPREGARNRATDALISLELELAALAYGHDTTDEHLGLVLGLVRDRLSRHWLRPYAGIVAEYDWEIEAEGGPA